MSLRTTCARLLLVLSVIRYVDVVVADPDCSGHGHKDDSGKCVCENEWPTSFEKPGWTGEDCSTPVFAAKADGDDATASCSAHGCSKLDQSQGREWACFAIPLTWK
jgi:hypothetical protein